MGTTKPPSDLKPLRGIRILSLALNLPGPAALMRLHAMGATCTKLEPPAGDPMRQYNPAVHAALHAGVKLVSADLRDAAGQAVIARLLKRTDVLLTSFRPSGLARLGLDWKTLHAAWPGLSQVAIVGSRGARAEEPGHDLTYMAEMGLVDGMDLPPSLFADMGGSLMASEAVLKAVLLKQRSGRGAYVEVALAGAAQYLGLPRTWGMTARGQLLGGAHAGYRIYPCKDGRVSVAALEPHFAAALCRAAGVSASGRNTMMAPGAHAAVASFFLERSCGELTALGAAEDIPLFALPA